MLTWIPGQADLQETLSSVLRVRARPVTGKRKTPG